MTVVLSDDIKFNVSYYKQCKKYLIICMKLSNLEFDILWYTYLSEKKQEIFITNEKELYIEKNSRKIPLKRATVLLKIINRIKNHENPIEILMENQKKFNQYVFDQIKND